MNATLERLQASELALAAFTTTFPLSRSIADFARFKHEHGLEFWYIDEARGVYVLRPRGATQ